MRNRYLFYLPWSPADAGGVSTVVNQLFRQIQQHGDLDPAILHPGNGYFLRPPGPGLRFMLSFLWRLPATLMRLRHACQNASVVNTHSAQLELVHFSLLQRLGWWTGRLLISVHGGDMRKANASTGWQRWLWRHILERANAVVAVSKEQAERVRDIAPAARIAVIYNGVDIESFLAEADRGKLALPKGRVILTVGQFESRKGHDILLRAFDRIAADYPDVQLALIGGDGPELPTLRTDAEKHGTRVTFFVDTTHAQVSAAMRQATMFALASRLEPFGIVFVEAAAHGLPVIGTRVGGVPEFVIDGVTGRCVPPEDVAALADALRDVLDHPEEARQRARRLLERVQSELNWRTAWARYAELIDQQR